MLRAKAWGSMPSGWAGWAAGDSALGWAAGDLVAMSGKVAFL
jgi:hypothetical protein